MIVLAITIEISDFFSSSMLESKGNIISATTTHKKIQI